MMEIVNLGRKYNITGCCQLIFVEKIYTYTVDSTYSHNLNPDPNYLSIRNNLPVTRLFACPICAYVQPINRLKWPIASWFIAQSVPNSLTILVFNREMNRL